MLLFKTVLIIQAASTQKKEFKENLALLKKSSLRFDGGKILSNRLVKKKAANRGEKLQKCEKLYI